jgi:hypothetical protein
VGELSTSGSDPQRDDSRDGEPPDEQSQARGRQSKIVQLTWLLALGGLISVATVAAIVIAANMLNGDRPEVILPILLVSGLIALVAALAILVGTFWILGLTRPGAAFGLPEGTLQAVIAMMIIMIFAITSLYLNASVQTKTLTSSNLTQQDLAKIPSDKIQSIKRDGDTYEVETVTANGVGDDFAKQLLTTLSTLVVAVAGFYFGAKSVEAGVRQGASSSGST